MRNQLGFSNIELLSNLIQLELAHLTGAYTLRTSRKLDRLNSFEA